MSHAAIKASRRMDLVGEFPVRHARYRSSGVAPGAGTAHFDLVMNQRLLAVLMIVSTVNSAQRLLRSVQYAGRPA